MKRISLLLAVLLAVSAPAFAKKDEAWVIKKTKVSEDKFAKTQTIIFPTLKPTLMSDFKKITGQNTPGGKFFVRIIKDKETSSMQIYYEKTNTSWGFYNSALDQDGTNLKFTEIASSTDTGGGILTTHEEFTIDISKDILEKYKDQNYLIKVYGKNDNFIFYLPDYYINGILKFINEN